VIRNVFTTRQLPLPTIKPVDSLESLLALIAGGHGISFLPGTFSPHRGLGLISRPLAEQRDDLAFSLWAVWRQDESSESVRNFIRLLRANAGSQSRE
jgi:DNA-binding transcriptional LysR family regulator